MSDPAFARPSWEGRYVPGQLVSHPDRPDWGVGQVQSVVAGRVTVNFEHAGKRTINAALVDLTPEPGGDDED